MFTDDQLKQAMNAFRIMHKAGTVLNRLIEENGWSDIDCAEQIEDTGDEFDVDMWRFLDACATPGYELFDCNEIAKAIEKELEERAIASAAE